MALHVVALDFGTTYSGYAFSVSPPNTELKNVEILSNQVWNSGTAEVASLKTPTCLLLTKECDLVAFGYEAEEQYADVVMDGNADDYYFFHRFKMNLHNNENIRMSMVLEDVRGQPLPAINVFSLSIQALKDHIDSSVEVKNIKLDKRQTKWVLTVPAIWTDTAKQFMRKSAEKAGIPRDNLIIALEPEAASIYCQTCPSPGSREIAEIGSRYMVVDLGGGTVDITVHEKNLNGTLKEVVKASGNNCGGTSIDNEFIQMFVRIFRRPIMNSLKSEFPDSYLYLLRSIENVKRVYQTSQTRKVNITIPRSTLDDLCQTYLGENITTVINSSSLSSNIEIFRDKIRIEPVFVKSLFKATCDTLVSLIQSVLQKCAVPNISNILLVGGFAECKVIQETMKTDFPNKNIILQEDSSTVVLKGAVLFGYKSDYISSRIARYTYGLRVWPHFDENIHDKKRRVIWEGNAYCDNVFNPFMEINTPIPIGHTIEKEYGTNSQFSCFYQLYYTESTDVQYTDTGECTLLGGFNMFFSNPGRNAMKAIFNFGDTEFSMTVLDPESGSERKEFFEIQRGTVDITVHEKNLNGTLKEVVKASGNNCGGTSIDNEFIQMFVRIFGRPIMNSLKSEFPDSYLYLLRSIENVKRVYQTSQTRKVNITIPRSTLDDLCQTYLGENITTVINSSSLSSNIEIFRDKIRIEPVFVKSLFKATCDTLVSLIQSVLQKCAVPNISNILLVGGFAECKVIQETMKTDFPNKNIILQEDSSTVVLKGAVLFGYKSDYISSRIARYTYGLRVWPHFDENIHDKKRRVIWEGNAYCDNVFNPFMEINTPIPIGHTIEKEYGTNSQFSCFYQLYYTESTDVQYTDTGECTLLGGFNMFFSNPGRNAMKAIFNFGDTEFSMTVLDPESGSERKEFFEIQR